MSPMDWAFLPLQRYFTFYGRSPRAEYWWFCLFQVAMSLITLMIDLLLGLGVPGAPISTGMLLGLALFFPSLAVSVRRLHDINRSGWTILLYSALYVVPLVVGGFLSVFLGFIGVVVMVIGVLLVSANYIFLMASEGNPGENAYGPNPYGLSYGQRY